MSRWLMIGKMLTAVSLGAFLQQATCTATIVPDPIVLPGEDEIDVRFVNQTTRALDVQFYASSALFGDAQQPLFVDANRITAGIGFAGQGVLDALSDDQITLSCAAARTIGTQGGRFLDADTGVEVGTGEARVQGVGFGYDCGDIITITYRRVNNTFQTSISVE